MFQGRLEQPGLVLKCDSSCLFPSSPSTGGWPQALLGFGLGISVTSSPLWAAPGLEHLCAPPCYSAFLPHPMASPEPPPARSRGTEQGINFATFPMFFILHPTRHHACPLSPPLQPHALTASCPQRVSWCSSPLASSSTRVSLKLLTGVEENRRGRSPSGFPSL